jgi:NhaP-type Na+/H+ or K+/H+ antiporter
MIDLRLTKAAYLDTHNTSHGFQPTAMVHSLPQAGFVWASLLFTIQGFCMTFSDIPGTILWRIIIPVAVVLIVAFWGIWVALHPREKSFEEDMPTPPQTPLTEMKDLSEVASIV